MDNKMKATIFSGLVILVPAHGAQGETTRAPQQSAPAPAEKSEGKSSGSALDAGTAVLNDPLGIVTFSIFSRRMPMLEEGPNGGAGDNSGDADSDDGN